MSQKPLEIRRLIYVKIDRKTHFTPVFASYISHLNPFRVRYPLQMLEPFSTVFETEQTHRKLSYTSRNWWALLLRVSFQLDRQLRKTSINFLMFAMDRPSPVRERQLSFVHWSRDLFFLSMSQNVQIIVDGGSTKDIDSCGERQGNLTHWDWREFVDHWRRWLLKTQIHSMRERSESYSSSIDGIVQNIVDDRSKKTNSFGERQGNLIGS